MFHPAASRRRHATRGDSSNAWNFSSRSQESWSRAATGRAPTPAPWLSAGKRVTSAISDEHLYGMPDSATTEIDQFDRIGSMRNDTNDSMKPCEVRALAQTHQNENGWKLYQTPKSIIDGKTNFLWKLLEDESSGWRKSRVLDLDPFRCS